MASEAETGKIYRSNYKDKHGRPVLVMRPRCQVGFSLLFLSWVKYLCVTIVSLMIFLSNWLIEIIIARKMNI